MIYLVIEIQKDFNGAVAYIVTTHTTEQEAESKYHSVLAAAAVSNLASHSATLLTDNGYMLKREFYEHAPILPEEPEEELGEGE